MTRYVPRVCGSEIFNHYRFGVSAARGYESDGRFVREIQIYCYMAFMYTSDLAKISWKEGQI